MGPAPSTTTSAAREISAESYETYVRRIHDIALAGSRDSAACGLTAAVMWGLPVPPSYALTLGESPVHLTPIGDVRVTRRAGTQGHELVLPREHLRQVGETWVTSPARTWVDCSALMEPRHLVAMGDSILHKKLATPGDLRDVLLWARRRRGVRTARRCLSELNGRAESAPESWLRWLMCEGGLPTPEVNHEVVAKGERVFRLDLAYKLLRIGIEYDGDWHSETRRHDEDRRLILARSGWLILVVFKEDLDDPPSLIQRIRDALTSRMPRHKRW